MLERIRAMLGYIGGDRRVRPRPDRIKQDVRRRQVNVAHELAPLVGRPPRELLDYRRYDQIIGRR
jgi:hypothetical protein